MMKRFICYQAILYLFLLNAGFVCAQSSGPDETLFFLSLEDIPLMRGLEELPSETLAFDKPEGRIIESYALMNKISQAEVAQYYAQALPSFGWGKVSPNRYFRNNEYLEISFETHEKQNYAKITIRPSN